MKQRPDFLAFLLPVPAVIWLGLAIAPAAHAGGLREIIGNINSIHFMRVTWCEASLKTCAVLLIIYTFSAWYYRSTRKNRRSDGEYGSARWEKASVINRKYASKDPERNRILTMNASISYDMYGHLRNLNTLVIGGSGSGKTRYYTKPNVFTAAASLILTDPAAEVLTSCGQLYVEEGYDLQVIDLYTFRDSTHYNPFAFLREEKDALILLTNYIGNTTPKDSVTQDPFWTKAERRLMLAMVFYAMYELPPEEQNFPTVCDMVRMLDAQNEGISEIDLLFARLPEDHTARRFYDGFKKAADRTASSIITAVMARLEIFELDSIRRIMCDNELDIAGLGDRKGAIFCVIPDNDTTFSCITGMLFTQAFQEMYLKAFYEDTRCLKVPMHVLMEEAGNITMPDDFASTLATMRKRNISCSLIFQDFSQGKALYGRLWDSVISNCDELLYMGSNSEETFEYISRKLGQETVDIDQFSISRGHNGHSSVNSSRIARDLMTPDEVSRLEGDTAILFIRGEYPVKDGKYDIRRHPNYRRTADGGLPLFDYTQYIRTERRLREERFDRRLYSDKAIRRIERTLSEFTFIEEET